MTVCQVLNKKKTFTNKLALKVNLFISLSSILLAFQFVLEMFYRFNYSQIMTDKFEAILCMFSAGSLVTSFVVLYCMVLCFNDSNYSQIFLPSQTIPDHYNFDRPKVCVLSTKSLIPILLLLLKTEKKTKKKRIRGIS